jgi:ech hydrogenase subunit C
MKLFRKSPWIIHYDGTSCNGCDIEVFASLTPVYDVERLGIINTGNPKHADVFLITGAVNEQNREAIQNTYHQMADPKVVVAVGICAATGNIFAECYNIHGGVDTVIPVDVYVPGCAARPESIIDGVLKGLDILEEKHIRMKTILSRIREVSVQKAQRSDVRPIYLLQKLAYRSEAENFNDYRITSLARPLKSIQEDVRDGVFLKAELLGEIIGCVRGRVEDGRYVISQLAVHPLYQKHGVSERLVRSIEAEGERLAPVLEVNAGYRSEHNVHFFRRMGYTATSCEEPAGRRSQVCMQKRVTAEKG